MQSLQEVAQALAAFNSTSEACKALSVESRLLSGLIYRSNYQFRSDKKLQLMKRIDQCLKKNVELKIGDLAKVLQEGLPGHIPCHQMYKHFLMKCVDAATLLGRCASLCLETFLMARQMLALGHFLQTMSAVAANLSRIWILCRHLCTHINLLYKQLINTPWMPKEAPPADLSGYFQVERADMENVNDIEQGSKDFMKNKGEEDKDVEMIDTEVVEDVGLPVRRDNEDFVSSIKKDQTIKATSGRISKNKKQRKNRKKFVNKLPLLMNKEAGMHCVQPAQTTH